MIAYEFEFTRNFLKKLMLIALAPEEHFLWIQRHSEGVSFRCEM